MIKDYNERIQSYNQTSEKNKGNLENKKQLISKLERASRDFEIYSEKILDFGNLEKELDERGKEYKSLVDNISGKKESSQKIKNEILEIEKVLKNLKDKEHQLNSFVEKLVDLLENEKKHKKFAEDLEKLNSEISKYSKFFSHSDNQKVREEFTTIVSRISEISARIKGLDDIIIEKEKRMNESKEKVDEIEKQKEEIQKLDRLVKNLKLFETALEKTQTELRENFVHTVNYTIEQIWPDIYPYEDFISARLGVEDRDYVLQLQRRSGEWVDVDGIASGGERSIASLALRIAFSSVLAPQLKWLVLDEPTHNLDLNAIEDLTETLRSKVGNFAEQVFLITHEKRMENAVTGELYRLVRDKGMDDFTKIERVN